MRTELTQQLIQKSFKKKASIGRLKVYEKSLEAPNKQREDSLKIEMLSVLQSDGEQSERCPQQFGSCSHTVCATCMTQLKDRDSLYHWTCHQCRAK